MVSVTRTTARFVCCLVLIAVTCRCGINHLQASESNDDVPNFFIAPITTELHRKVVATDATAYAVVNATSLIVDDEFDVTALDVDVFREGLKVLATDPEPSLKLVSRFHNFTRNRAAEKKLENALKQIAREAGFAKTQSSTTRSSTTWNRFAERIKKTTESDFDIQEPIVANELLRAYPIRTNLSHVVFGDVDCVIEIRRPFDGRQKDLSKGLRSAISSVVNSFSLKSKRNLSFHVSTTDAGEEIFEELFRNEPDSVANVFARELGFEKAYYTHSPNGGAPQKLIGKAAPDFVLKMLDEQPFSLHEKIEGKTALLTFWGVACGPCRLEAPHLSNLFEEYGSRQFTVIGINAYNESPKVVSRYVDENELRHPILINGRKIARQSYFVGAYPTTFWINRGGIVIDYVIGFEKGDEALIEERIIRLLED